MLGAAIAAGASLIGGLFGRSSAKKQAAKEEAAIRKANDDASAAAAQMNRQVRARADAAALVPVATEREHFSSTASAGGVNMDAFLAAAERGGFNPLTFLRSGALSLFAQTQADEYTEDWTCTTGERAMDAALSGTYLPQLSPVIAQTKVPGVGEVFGSALTAGANQYLSDMSQQQQNQFQMDLLKAKLSGIGASGSYVGPRSGYVPSSFMSGGASTRGGGALAASHSTSGDVWNPGWFTMPSGSIQPSSAVKQPSTTWEDLVASIDQFRRKSDEVLHSPWSSWLVKAPAFFTGADVKRLAPKPAGPGFSWRDFSSGVDDTINRWLLP